MQKLRIQAFAGMTLLAWMLLAIAPDASLAATVYCSKDGTICSPPYSNCSGTNCLNICGNPAAFGYSTFGSASVWENSVSSSCSQAYSNYAALTITATAGANGTITPSGAVSVAHGQTASFTATPNAGYAILNFTSGCPGSPSGNNYITTSIENDCSVTANFVRSYTVSTSVGPNGTVTPASRNVNAGTIATFTITPSAGYSILSASGCGGSMYGTNLFQTPAINADCTVSVSFGHTVSTSAGLGGQFTPTMRAVATSDTTTFTVTPVTGYSIASVSGCGGSLSANTYTTSSITGACTVTATFTGSLAAGTAITCRTSGPSNCYQTVDSCTGTDCATLCLNPSGYGMTQTSHSTGWNFDNGDALCTDNWTMGGATYSVTPSVYGGGTITPNTAQSVTAGGTKAFTLSANAGYTLYKVTGTCGGSLSGSTFTTSAVNANCTVIGNYSAAAADGYRVNSGQELMINAHTVCKKITNNNASAIFVPAKTATEWTQFRTNATGITQANCP